MGGNPSALAPKAPVVAVSKQTYTKALVGSRQTMAISTKHRGTFDTPDARKLGASGR